jgi:proline iminopeptidase
LCVLAAAAGALTSVASCSSAPPGASEGFFTTADGARLYYRVLGDGAQTVIAPLASLHSTHLDPLAKGRRLVLYDPRGRGRSERVEPARVSLDHQISDLEAVRAQVGADRVSLIGWSGMGMELFVYALRHPDRVERLVQLAPVPPRREPYSEQMMRDRRERSDREAAAEINRRLDAGEYKDRHEELCRDIGRATNRASFADPARSSEVPDLCQYETEWPENLWPYFDALLGSFGEFDWRARLAEVKAPRLVIHGAQDNIPLEGNREWAAGRPEARLLVVEKSGHWPHYEQPAPVLRAIDAFLRGEWPSGSEAIPASS